MKKNIFDLIILFPFVWSFSGVFLYPNGKKSLVVFVFLAAIISLYSYGIETIKENIKNTKLLWLLIILLIFAAWAYPYYYYSSDRIRTFVTLSIYFLVFPQSILSKINLKHLTVLGAITASIFTFFQIYIFEHTRGDWDINVVHYATFIASITIFALYFLLQSKTIKQGATWFIVLLFSIIPLFYTQSRGLWLALLIAATVLIVKTLITDKKNILFLAPIAVIMALSLYLSSEKINERITQTRNEIHQIANGNFTASIGAHLQMWKAGMYLFEESPILGVGNKDKEHKEDLYQKGEIPLDVVKYNHFHNQYIDELVKYGIVGLALLLSIILLPIYYFSTKNSPHKWPGFLIILIYLIGSLTDVTFKHGNTLTFYLMVIYITLCAPRLLEDSPDK
jgi:O-antigen ligase